MEDPSLLLYCEKKELYVSLGAPLHTGPFGLDIYRPILKAFDRLMQKRKDVTCRTFTYGRIQKFCYATDNPHLIEEYGPFVEKLKFFNDWHSSLVCFLTAYYFGTLDYYVQNSNGYRWYSPVTPDDETYDIGFTQGCKAWRLLIFQHAVRLQGELERGYINRLKRKMRLLENDPEAMIDACITIMQKFYRSLMNWAPVRLRERDEEIPLDLLDRSIEAAKAMGLPADFYANLTPLYEPA